MVYSFRVAAMEEIATERSTGFGASAGTSFLSSVGAATLIICTAISKQEECIVATYAWGLECSISSAESSDWVTTDNCGYARRTSRFQ